MPTHKGLLSIIKTNWIHFVGFYICIEVFMLVPAIGHLAQSHEFKFFLGEAILPAIILLFGYGLIPLVCFYATLFLLDLTFFSKTKFSAFTIVLIEWGIIVPVFVYWAFYYHYWLWLVLAASFYITQYVRINKILR